MHTKHNDITRHMNEKDWLISHLLKDGIIFYKNVYNEGFWNEQNIYANKRERERERERER